MDRRFDNTEVCSEYGFTHQYGAQCDGRDTKTSHTMPCVHAFDNQMEAQLQFFDLSNREFIWLVKSHWLHPNKEQQKFFPW